MHLGGEPVKPNAPLWVENNPNAGGGGVAVTMVEQQRGGGGDVGVEMKVVFEDGDGDGVERVTVVRWRDCGSGVRVAVTGAEW
ncbi:hypothetical protein Tco_0883587 [Tanacetum coccineum]